MKTPDPVLVSLLHVAAATQIVVALSSVSLAWLLWMSGVFRHASTNAQDLFVTHLLFNACATLTFAILTFRFSDEFAAARHPLCRWVAAAVAFYWLVRAWGQGIAWLEGPSSTGALHFLLFVVYGAVAGIYASSMLRLGTSG